ncbi:MAG TPA: rhodanese-like domain-containing protein [Kofleriaceae bacterium]|nr:rhodanese-like domain-containing protein [Kofleriaceae bacterium]
MQRRAFLLLFAGAASLGALGPSQRASAEPSAADLKRLTIDEVSAKIHAPKTFIFDNNSKESWAAGHVPTAKWLDDESVTAAALGPDKKATLIFYCHDEG